MTGNAEPTRSTRSSDAASLVRTCRQQSGLSQAQLADRLGTTQSAVSRWERGHEEPRLSTLRSILGACDRALVLHAVAVDDGVDRAQIRQHLTMTPDQRLMSVVNVSHLLAGARRISR